MLKQQTNEHTHTNMTNTQFLRKFIESHGKTSGNAGRFYARDGVLFARPTTKSASMQVLPTWGPKLRCAMSNSLVPLVWFPKDAGHYVVFGHAHSISVNSASPPISDGRFAPFRSIAQYLTYPSSQPDVISKYLVETKLPRIGVTDIPIRFGLEELFGKGCLITPDDLHWLLACASLGIDAASLSHDSFDLVRPYKTFIDVLPLNAEYGASSKQQLMFDYAVTRWAKEQLEKFRSVRNHAFQLREIIAELHRSSEEDGSLLSSLHKLLDSEIRSLCQNDVDHVREVSRSLASNLYTVGARFSPESSPATRETFQIVTGGTQEFYTREAAVLALTTSTAVLSPHRFHSICFALGDYAVAPVQLDDAFTQLHTARNAFNRLLEFARLAPVGDTLGIALNPDNLEALSLAYDLVSEEVTNLRGPFA